MSDATSDFDEARANARAIAARTSADGIAPTGDAETARQAYSVQAADAARAAQQLKEAAQRREDEIRRMLNEHRALMQQELGPLLDQIKQLEEGIWTVSLYLGRDEQITQIADGDPAPAGTPITLRQLVLAMDEECQIAAEDGGIDASRVSDFADWLTADPAHVQQVLPDEKGVVVLVPSRQRRRDRSMDQENKISHWLIRNGQKLYLMVTDIDVGDRLLPKRTEFVDYFYALPRYGQNERQPLQPGTDEWIRAERGASAQRRHFMRLMLILQGLVDRTTVWQPLPAPVNFLTLAAQDNDQVRVINEIDLVLGTGRLPFRERQRQLLAELRPGMRIVGAFAGEAWRGVNDEDSERRGQHDRLYPAGAAAPASHTPHVIEEKLPGGGFKFRYRRGDTVSDRDIWGNYRGERAPKTRASCTIRRTDEFVLPVDLVTEDELRGYLHARTERHQYLFMVPVIKAVIEVKRRERVAEEPFRLLLAGRLAEEYTLDVGDAQQHLDELVSWWKLTNRWYKPLVGDPKLETKAITAIVKEFGDRRDAQRATAVAATRVGALRVDHPDAICVARRRDGDLVVYRPAGGENVWLHEHRYSPTGIARPAREWVQVTGRTRAGQQELWSADRWAGWNHDALRAEHLTGPEREQLRDELLAQARTHGTPVAVVYQQGGGRFSPRTLQAFLWDADERQTRVRSRGLNEPGDLMSVLLAGWRRGQGGHVVLDDPRVCNAHWGRYKDPQWGQVPWSEQKREHLLWVDETQRETIAAIAEQIQQRKELDDAYRQRVWNIRNLLRDRWETAEWERHHTRFLEDYAGAEDLWEGHKKTLRVRFPTPQYLEAMVGEMLDAGVEPSTITVGEMISRSSHARFVRNVPDSVTSMAVYVEPAEPGTPDGAGQN